MCGCSCSTETTSKTGATTGATAYRVPDMSCGHCAGTIRDAFGKAMPGAAVEIDLDAKIVRVSGDQALAQRTLGEAGYPAEQVA